MAKHGTASRLSTDQFAEFASAVVRNLPRDLDPARVQGWIEEGDALARLLAAAFSGREVSEPEQSPAPKVVPLTVSADDEEFTLDVNNDQDPMEVVSSVGFDKKSWQYLGPAFSGKETRRVKLIRLGFVKGLKEARQKADQLGFRLLEGQARESFKAKYPVPDGKGPVVFGGSVWQSPHGDARVACLYECGGVWNSHFYWSDYGWDGDYRWAVVSK